MSHGCLNTRPKRGMIPAHVVRYAAPAINGKLGYAVIEQGSYQCCGVRIDGLGPEAAVATMLQARYGSARAVHLCNSYTLALASRNETYRRVLNTGDVNLADGHYVAMIGRWRGQKDLRERVYGPALMLATMDRGRDVGLRHYLYGTTPETINRLVDRLSAMYPGIDIVGAEAPPFRRITAHEEEELADRIEHAKPDIMWIGVGTPRQDEFVAQHVARLPCTLVPVGAAFDFNSGSKRSAPRLIQRMGMEWLFRFVQEPRRLWRRYLIGIPVFIWGVVLDIVRRPPELAPSATAPIAAAVAPIVGLPAPALVVAAPPVAPAARMAADGAPPGPRLLRPPAVVMSDEP
jgi:N-acetylglucosaminyldiphosphoundecaprenol N-acetyl-beta-D-mannosaminyltransferase